MKKIHNFAKDKLILKKLKEAWDSKKVTIKMKNEYIKEGRKQLQIIQKEEVEIKASVARAN